MRIRKRAGEMEMERERESTRAYDKTSIAEIIQMNRADIV